MQSYYTFARTISITAHHNRAGKLFKMLLNAIYVTYQFLSTRNVNYFAKNAI